MTVALPPGLLDRLDDLWFEQYAAYARVHPAGSVLEADGWRAARLGPAAPVFNVATAAPGGRPTNVAALDALFDTVRDYRIWLRDGADGTGRVLGALGFTIAEVLAAMWRPLTAAPPPPEVPAGYELLRLTDRGAIIDALTINRWSLWIGPERTAEVFPDAWAAASSGDRRFYSARWEGQEVASAQLFVHAGVAGVYSVWTDDEHRGHGLATALLGRMLADAAADGVVAAALQAGPQAAVLYGRLGFEAYGEYRIHHAPEPG